jgi:hypothetical protein
MGSQIGKHFLAGHQFQATLQFSPTFIKHFDRLRITVAESRLLDLR